MSIDFSLEPITNKAHQTKLEKNIEDEPKKERLECDSNFEKNRKLQELYDRLWTAADELRANSNLTSTQYSQPVLGILFLRYAFYKFAEVEEKLKKKLEERDRPIRKIDFEREGVVFLPEKARYSYLLSLPESAGIGSKIDEAINQIESENNELRDVLPRNFNSIDDRVLENLLKLFHEISVELDRDIFGRIYEYFLGKFAMQEGQGAGEFYTPTSIVRLIVEILEPYYGMILDPACGSGGMFVQSARFVQDHLRDPYKEISIYGQEKASSTVRLCKMNMAIHGLSGDIREGNTYYEDVFNKHGQFDFVMANPPFNVNNVDKEAIKDDPRYPFGIPVPDNANYLWIQIFYSMLKDTGRAGFVMANSASDAGHSELEIREKMIKEGVIDVIISISSNFFYTKTLPVTLWFLNKEKQYGNKDKVLFIDARKIYSQIDKSHREFSSQQLEFISNIVRLFRGKKIETTKCSSEMMEKYFPNMKYQNIKGLCKEANIDEIIRHNYSLNPSIYIETDVTDGDNNYDFYERLEYLKSELIELNRKSNSLLKIIEESLNNLLSE
jgi:type I restriction enzyme M protein